MLCRAVYRRQKLRLLSYFVLLTVARSGSRYRFSGGHGASARVLEITPQRRTGQLDAISRVKYLAVGSLFRIAF